MTSTGILQGSQVGCSFLMEGSAESKEGQGVEHIHRIVT